jgi:hypothetical protein
LASPSRNVENGVDSEDDCLIVAEFQAPSTPRSVVEHKRQRTSAGLFHMQHYHQDN